MATSCPCRRDHGKRHLGDPAKIAAGRDEAAARQPNSLSAYDQYLRRIRVLHHDARRGGGSYPAASIAPRNRSRYSAAASLAILCHTLNLLHGWSADPQFDVKEAARLSQLVLSIDENDPETLACVGWAKIFISHDAATAAEMVDRAVALNPNSAIAWSYRGLAYLYAGESEEALRSFEHFMRLSPLDPMQFGIIAMMSLAYIGLGRFDEAVIAARKSIGKHPTFMPAHYCLASALAHLGRKEDASKAVQQILHLQPDFRTSRASGHWPLLFAEACGKPVCRNDDAACRLHASQRGRRRLGARLVDVGDRLSIATTTSCPGDGRCWLARRQGRVADASDLAEMGDAPARCAAALVVGDSITRARWRDDGLRRLTSRSRSPAARPPRRSPTRR